MRYSKNKWLDLGCIPIKIVVKIDKVLISIALNIAFIFLVLIFESFTIQYNLLQ